MLNWGVCLWCMLSSIRKEEVRGGAPKKVVYREVVEERGNGERFMLLWLKGLGIF